MRRRNSVVVEDTGTCAKLDAACAERVSQVINRCSEKHSAELREALRECASHADTAACEERAQERYRDQVADCVGGE